MLYPEVNATIRNNKEPNWTPRPYSTPIMSMGEQRRAKPTEAWPDGELLWEIAAEWAAYGQFSADAYRNYPKELGHSKTQYFKGLGATFGDIRVTTSMQIWDRMERMPDFERNYEGQQLLYILDCARAASTGAGAHSVYIDFCHILKLSVVSDDWVTFFKQYLALMVRIKGRGMGAEELLKAFFNSRFLVSVMESRLLKQQVDDAMSMPVWPDVNDLVDKWTNILTTKKETRGLERDHGVQANRADFEDDDDSDDGREQHGYASRAGSGNRHASHACDNCGELGHIYPNCTKQLEVCDECGDKHNTKFHEKVSERMRSNKAKRLAGVAAKRPVDKDRKKAASDRRPKKTAHLAATEGMYEAAFKAMLEIKKKEGDSETGLAADVIADDEDEMFEFFGFHDGLEKLAEGGDSDSATPGLKVTEREIDVEDISDEFDVEDIMNMKEYSYVDYANHMILPSVWSQGRSEKCELSDDNFEIEMSEATRNLVMGHETPACKDDQVVGACVATSHQGSTTESTSPTTERRAPEHVAIDVVEEAVEEGAQSRTVGILGRCMISVARFMLCVARCWTIGALWLLARSGANASDGDVQVCRMEQGIGPIYRGRDMTVFTCPSYDATMLAYPSLVGKKLSEDPAYKYVIDTGYTRHLFQEPDTLKDLKPVKSVAVKGIIGKKYVEKIGVHRAIGKTFVAS
jgi:hypothetical protein